MRLVVDLTPLLPGGANGGVKPAIAEFLKGLSRHERPRFDLFLLTNSATDREAAGWFPDKLVTHCLDHSGRQGSLPRSFFREQRFDALYAPFGGVRFPHSGLPTVAMVVDLLHRDYPASLSERDRQWREHYFSRMVIAADRFQVISDFTGRQLQHHYKVPAEKIFRTYLPIQDRLARQPMATASRTEEYFFYPANFWPHKNHEVLFIAYQIYRRRFGDAAWRLALTGSDSERQRQLRLLAETLDVADRIDFLGHLPEHELLRVYGRASGLVFPSLHEGFGIPPLEAMRFGVPVIASGNGSLGEVVGSAALRVDPRKPLELADAMGNLTRSPAIQKELREKGAARAAEFSFANELSRLADALAQLADPANARTASESLRRRLSLGRTRLLNSGRTLAKRAYGFVRDRV